MVEDILARLVAFPSVVGTPNTPIVDWIAGYCRSHGAAVRVLPGPEGDRANLFATIGPADVPGYVLSGHTDVVPAGEDGWSADPFTLRRDGDRLYGRGTTDMKGFLACALAALPVLAATALERPLHLAFSYDEEAGCRGVPHMIAELPHLAPRRSASSSASRAAFRLSWPIRARRRHGWRWKGVRAIPRGPTRGSTQSMRWSRC